MARPLALVSAIVCWLSFCLILSFPISPNFSCTRERSLIPLRLLTEWGHGEEENQEDSVPAVEGGDNTGQSAAPTPTPAVTAPVDDDDAEEPLDAGLAIELEPESPEKRRSEEEEDEEEEPELFARYLVHTPAAGAARKRPSSSTISASG